MNPFSKPGQPNQPKGPPPKGIPPKGK